ncbi:hypothetical protein DsansV1_C35g0229771 [Dioscorea sansibarensis]
MTFGIIKRFEKSISVTLWLIEIQVHKGNEVFGNSMRIFIDTSAGMSSNRIKVSK